MNTSPQSSTKLDAILRNQEALLHNQQRLDRKLDQILSFTSLLPLAVYMLTTASPVIPVQPTTSASAPTAVPFALSLPAAGDQPQSDEERLSTDNLFQLSKKAKSSANFAVQLLKELFKPSELEGRNIAGGRGKALFPGLQSLTISSKGIFFTILFTVCLSLEDSLPMFAISFNIKRCSKVPQELPCSHPYELGDYIFK